MKKERILTVIVTCFVSLLVVCARVSHKAMKPASKTTRIAKNIVTPLKEIKPVTKPVLDTVTDPTVINLAGQMLQEQENSVEAQGRSQEPISMSDEEIQLAPRLSRPHIYHRRGVAKVRLNDLQGAIEDFNKAVELNSSVAEFYYDRGTVKKSLGKSEEAKTDLQRARELGLEFEK